MNIQPVYLTSRAKMTHIKDENTTLCGEIVTNKAVHMQKTSIESFKTYRIFCNKCVSKLKEGL